MPKEESWQVLVSESARKDFYALDKKMQERMRKGFAALAKNPYESRSGADIKRLANVSPPPYRLRVGDHRAVYAIAGKEVRITEILHRGKGYGWLD